MRALWSTLRETPVTLSLVFAVVILSFILLAVEITPFSELLTAQPVPLVDGARSHAHQTDRRIFQPNITWTADGTLTTEATSTRSPWSWQATLATALSGQGFLQVQRHNGEVEEYGISLFHQLHCLQMIRSLLLNQSWASHHHDAGQVDDGPHWAHCVDYLAQVRFLVSMPTAVIHNSRHFLATELQLTISVTEYPLLGR